MLKGNKKIYIFLMRREPNTYANFIYKKKDGPHKRSKDYYYY